MKQTQPRAGRPPRLSRRGVFLFRVGPGTDPPPCAEFPRVELSSAGPMDLCPVGAQGAKKGLSSIRTLKLYITQQCFDKRNMVYQLTFLPNAWSSYKPLRGDARHDEQHDT